MRIISAFEQFDQRRVNLESRALDACFRPDVGQCFEQNDEFRAAIGVSAVVERVYTEKNVARGDRFRPGQRMGQKNRVTRWNISNRNSRTDFLFRSLLRNIDVIGERRSAKDAVVDLHDTVFLCA